MTNRIQTYFFLGLFTASGILAAFLFLPFIQALVLAVIISVAINSPYEWLVKKLFGSRIIAALIAVIAVIVVICLPLAYFTTQITREAFQLYGIIDDSNIDLAGISQMIEKPFKALSVPINIDLKEYATHSVNFLVSNAGGLLSKTASLALDLFLVLMATFFFLKDGKKFKAALIAMSPLSDKHDNAIIKQLQGTINSVVHGTLLLAVLRGFIAGIGFVIFGISNATLWGALTALASFVPGLGTAIVIVPAVIYLFAIGSFWPAIGLTLWGALIVGLIDNLLAPYLFSKSVDVHPIIVLFAVLGGLSIFGGLGFLFGPIIVSLFFALLTIYREIFSGNKSTGV